jgi:uncharacterized protein YjbI with pentapeptide repeats
VPEGSQSATSVSDDRRRKLQADCERCFALCCVVPAFSASADFAIDKPAGQPCPHLRPEFRCSVHDQLRPRGFPGCASYDCFGAGQQIAQVTFGGRDWRRAPETAAQMFQAFTIMRQLHELLWDLNEALALPAARPLHGELHAAFEETERLTRNSPDALAALDMAALRENVNALLLRTSELVRTGASRPGAGRTGAGRTGAGPTGAGRTGASLHGADLRGADLAGKDLSRADLSCASLRGACLIGAKLSGADLSMADLTGADLRGADLSGADLSGSIFVTQSQVDAARGDAGTKLPAALARPAYWPMSP